MLEPAVEVVALEPAVEEMVGPVAVLEPAVEIFVQEMGLKPCPPTHRHRPQHYDALGNNDELDYSSCYAKQRMM